MSENAVCWKMLTKTANEILKSDQIKETEPLKLDLNLLHNNTIPHSVGVTQTILGISSKPS